MIEQTTVCPLLPLDRRPYRQFLVGECPHFGETIVNCREIALVTVGGIVDSDIWAVATSKT